MSCSGVGADKLILAIVCQVSGTQLGASVPWDDDRTFGEALLEPTVIYVRRLLALIGAQGVDVRVRAS